MKRICPKYLSCKIDECKHKIQHEECDMCNENCDDYPESSTCLPALKTLREHKLKKLKLYKNVTN